MKRRQDLLIPIGHESIVVVDSETEQIKWKVRVFMPGTTDLNMGGREGREDVVFKFFKVHDHLDQSILSFGYTGDEQWKEVGEHKLGSVTIEQTGKPITLPNEKVYTPKSRIAIDDLTLDEEIVPWKTLEALVRKALHNYELWQISEEPYNELYQVSKT